MQEARIGNTFMRIVGFCSRCKAVASNYDTNDRNPELEPNPTLAKYRKHELGTLFGTYHQVEVIGSQDQFRRLLPDYPLPKDRKFDQIYGIVRKGDDLKVRVSEQRIEFDPSYQAK
jgi:MOSC domain